MSWTKEYSDFTKKMKKKKTKYTHKQTDTNTPTLTQQKYTLPHSIVLWAK